MPDEPLEQTEESFDDLIERLEGTTSKLGTTVENLAGHIDKFVGELGKLNVAHAAAEIPATAREGINDAASVAGAGGETAVHAATVPVAVVEDAVKDTEHAATATKKAIKRGFRLRKGRG